MLKIIFMYFGPSNLLACAKMRRSRGKSSSQDWVAEEKGTMRGRSHKHHPSRTAFLLDIMFSHSSEYPLVHKLFCKIRGSIKNRVQFMVYSTCPWKHVESFTYINRLLVGALQSFFIVWNRWHIEQFRKDEAWHSLPANHLYLIITTLIRIIIKKEWSNKTWLLQYTLLFRKWKDRWVTMQFILICFSYLWDLSSAAAVILVSCHGILNFSWK